MITFRECPTKGYAARTKANADADITLAFAADFNTAGERLTQKYVQELRRRIFKFPAEMGKLNYAMIESVVKYITQFPKPFTINVAGNGLYTMYRNGWNQEDCDVFAHLHISNILKHPRMSSTCTLIRSGGQTGFDEAGIRSAVKLGIPALVYAPKGWLFRTEYGVDVADEKQFKARFFRP